MRTGILIIGSLLWESDPKGFRQEWRSTRLDLGHAMRVKSPIRYGKLSTSAARGGTFTMTYLGFSDDANCQAIVVPCKVHTGDGAALVAEAEALWGAERRGPATGGNIGAGWGCVALLCPDNSQSSKLAMAWKKNFQRNATTPVGPVSKDGFLQIPWPKRADGSLVDLDLLLATSTKPDPKPPTAQDIAEAWIVKDHDDYFFENVRSGIRTKDDLAIWRVMEHRPDWLKLREEKYRDAIAILRAEAIRAVGVS
jgi:hypothetical protein